MDGDIAPLPDIARLCVELLIQRARAYIYTTLSPPALAAAHTETDVDFLIETLQRAEAAFS